MVIRNATLPEPKKYPPLHGLFCSDGERLRCDLKKYRGMRIPCDEVKAKKFKCPGILRIPKKTPWVSLANSDGARLRRDSVKYCGMKICERIEKIMPCPLEAPSCDRKDGCFGRCGRGFPHYEVPRGGIQGGKFVQTGIEWFRYY